MALRSPSPSLYWSGTLTGQTGAHSPQLVQMSGSTKRAWWYTLALKSPGSPSRPVSSELVTISMFRWRPASTSLGASVHIEQSLVGKVLSSCAMCPPRAGAFSTR